MPSNFWAFLGVVLFCICWCIPAVLLHVVIATILLFLRKGILFREQVVEELGKRILPLLEQQDADSIKNLYRIMRIKRVSFVFAIFLRYIIFFSFIRPLSLAYVFLFICVISLLLWICCAIYATVRTRKISSQLPILFSTLKTFIKNSSR